MQRLACLCFLFALLHCQQSLPTQVAPHAQPITAKVEDYTTAIQMSGISGPITLTVDGTPLLQIMEPDPTRSQEATANALFQFLADNYHVWTIPQNTTPQASLYGYGFGLCQMESRILCSLWYQNDLKARLIAWDKHTMAEVRWDDTWRIYDAQHKVNFSNLWQKPTSFADLVKGPAYPETALDPIGYGDEIMQSWYEEAKPKRRPRSNRIERPLNHIQQAQVITIRPRISDTPFTLPVNPAPRNRLRDNLLPGYLLTIEQESDGAPITLDTGLPILGVGPQLQANGKAKVDGKVVGIDALKGTCKPVHFTLPAGRMLEVHYALADWIGKRLFQSGTQLALPAQHETTSLKVFTNTEQPQVALTNLSWEPETNSKAWHFQCDIIWKNITDQAPLSYHFFFDELSSDLPLEVWRYLHDWAWTWNPDEHGSSGKHTVKLVFRPENKATDTLRRPEQYRTLMIHGKGPYLPAGQYLKTTITLPE